MVIRNDLRLTPVDLYESITNYKYSFYCHRPSTQQNNYYLARSILITINDYITSGYTYKTRRQDGYNWTSYKLTYLYLHFLLYLSSHKATILLISRLLDLRLFHFSNILKYVKKVFYAPSLNVIILWYYNPVQYFTRPIDAYNITLLILIKVNYSVLYYVLEMIFQRKFYVLYVLFYFGYQWFPINELEVKNVSKSSN